MDIHSGVIVVTLFAVVGAYFSIRAAVKNMQTARKLSFYSLRKRHNANAWRFLFFTMLLVAFAYWLPTGGEQAIYRVYPPSPTQSLTPTITMTPSITLSPTITLTPSLTLTPSVSDTPTLTPTPYLPVAIEALFAGPVTPNPDSVFTAIQFSTQFDGVNSVDPKTVFELPIETMYGGFDYNNTLPGVQWTALWFRSGELVCYETEPWRAEWGTGGIGGYTECSAPIGGWQPGQYEVQIFMGYEWKVVGRFVVLDSLTPSTTPDLSNPASSTSTP
ncbi:MAG TPA: hypothetical protein PKL78_13050 [Anaerolineales bacterium]|nr:hypothetical protein [Anaerolineales bacterium]HNO30418.1 hypothetical protein [Anaerolineales bacterium]